MKKRRFLIAAFSVVHFFSMLKAQNISVYVSDAGNFSNPPWKILKFNENGESGQIFISDHLAWPQDILFLEESNTVLISNLNSGRISKFDASTGAFIGEFATGVGGPTRMKIGPEGLLYVLQAFGSERVRRYDLDGNLFDEFTSVGVSNSIGIDWDTEGNLYVSSYTEATVRKFSPSGANLGLFINANLDGPTNIWFAENGDLLVLDFDGAAVKRFDSAGAYLGVFISGLPQCEGVAFLPDGNLLIGVGGTSSVRIYTPEGALVGDLIAPGALGLLRPNAIVLRNEGPTSTQPVIYKAVDFVIPSVGTLFHILKPEELQEVASLLVYNITGTVVHTIDFTESTTLDASLLADGFYIIIGRLPNGVLVRQKIQVLH